MRRLFLALALAVVPLTAGCAILDNPTSAPAPLEQTVVDEKALVLALETFDTTLTSVDILVDNGYIKPGSARALQIAGYIDTAKRALQTASAAQRAGSTASYLEAIDQARAAIAGVKVLLQQGD